MKRARPVAFGLLDLHPWEFARYTVREFEEKVAGACRRWALFYDLAAWHAAPIIASSEKYSRDNPPPDLGDLLGRPMLPLDPRDDDELDDDELDEAEEADRLDDARETAAVSEEAGYVKRGRYTEEQMKQMHRGEPVG